MVADKKNLARNLGSIILLLVLSGSLCLNVALATKLRTALAPHVGGVKIGANLASVPVIDSSGNRRHLRLDDGRWSVVYILSPSCVWCARNLNNIRAMARGSGSKYRFIGLSTTSSKLSEYLKSTPLPFPVLAADSSRLPDGLDLSGTPQTIVVAPNGRVRKVWRGALQGAPRSDAEAFFHIALPGVAENGSSP